MCDIMAMTTLPSHNNMFYRISSGGLRFEVMAPHSAAIGLANKPGGKCDVWVVIGHDELTWIKSEGGGNSIGTSDILHAHEYRPFWLLWSTTEGIKLGQGNNARAILSCYCNTELNYVTFSSAGRSGYDRNNEVHWRIELPPVLAKPVMKSITGGDMYWHDVEPSDEQLPDGAFIGGYEKEPLYIIRAAHLGSLTPGKFVPSEGTGYISWGGQALDKNEFEILCGFDCFWVPTVDDKIPVNAVEGGHAEQSNEKLYVGRALYNGHMIPGKVQPTHRCCYIAYDGKEVGHTKYEILVSGNNNVRCANKMIIKHISVAGPPNPATETDDDDDDDDY